MKLSELEVGKSGRILSVGGEGALHQHFLDMGVIPSAVIKVVKYAPFGDPIECKIHGYELTLRLEEAGRIEVEEVTDKEEDIQKEDFLREAEHPGLGEGGRFHDSKTEHALSEDTVLSFALAGNQNSGKTTLFNQLTGANQHVGNFPGVTVDRKSGAIRNHPNTEVTDLPGIYSLSPYSAEEVISRQFIINEHPHAIINIVDATNIERNLYLTLQLIELGKPMVLALNMMDEVRNNGGAVHINEMEEMLGIPVVPISASKGEGIDELVRHALHVAKYQEKPSRLDFCDKEDHNGAVHRCLHGIMHLIEDHAQKADIPVRFAATKVVEGDKRVLEALHLEENEKEMLQHIIAQMEEERGLDAPAAIADMRYSFIERLSRSCVLHPSESIERKRSEKADEFLTGKYTAIPAFIAIMGLVFWLTFYVIGAGLQNLLAAGIDALGAATAEFLARVNVNPVLSSLVTEGIFGGVGSVLSFIPIIVVLFFFLSMLEDSGYMARVAFVMDKLLRKIGLSGRSIVPMLVGLGCTVPGVMASRTLPSERDRKMTILLTPFISCSAKLPIYGFFANAFFPKYAWIVMLLLYIIGIIVGIIVALIFKKTLFQGEAVPFVMELPNYRLPGLKNVLRLMWDKAKDFLQRAFTVIFLATIIVWLLRTFNGYLFLASDPSESILAEIAGLITPAFIPLGFGDWRVSTALITGFLAKESVVSTLQLLFAGTPLTSVLTPLAASSLLVFCLLYTPCVAAISSIRRELGGKWAIGCVVMQCGVAWICAFIIYTLGHLFGL